MYLAISVIHQLNHCFLENAFDDLGYVWQILIDQNKIQFY